MAWTDESTLSIFGHALPEALIAVTRRDLRPVTGTVSQATMTTASTYCHACGYLYC